MSAVATAIAGSAIIGGIVQSNAASSAADAQQAATQASIGEQRRQFDLNRSDLKPFRDAGVAVLPQLSSGLAPGGDFNRDFTLADFTKDPGYQFRMDQGQQALERSAAARGGLLSGGTLKALDRYGQDYGSNEYSAAYNRFNNDRTTRFNRLSALAGTGQTATNAGVAAGNQSAGTISDLYTQGGNARAAGYIGRSNAINNGVQSLGNFYLQQQYMNRMPSVQSQFGSSADALAGG